MKKLLLSSMVAMILVGCGSDSSSEAPSTEVTTIAGLEGYWDVSSSKDGKHDELYASYFANGEIGLYDYQKDDYGNGKDCYNTGMSYTEIRKDIVGNFYFYNTKDEKKGLLFNAEISTDALTLINPFNPNEVKIYKHPSVALTDIESKLCKN